MQYIVYVLHENPVVTLYVLHGAGDRVSKKLRGEEV